MSSKRSREEASWCTIESDPGIFTLLIEKLGVKGVQVEEIYDLESPPLLPSIYGFIFLFKWMKSSGNDEKANDLYENNSDDVFFAQQEITNACATQAILHILLNSSVDLGPVLENFKSFSQELPSDMRGLCLSNSLEIRQIHNEFGNLNEILAFGDDEDEKDDGKKSKDPFHFVAFIYKNGTIYELDGLKESPKTHVKCDVTEWESKVLEIIRTRVAPDSESEIRFNLMALCADRRESLKAEIAGLSAKLSSEYSENESPEKTSLLTKRFQAQQELDEEEAKWSRYRKDWADRQKQYSEATVVKSSPKSPKDIKLSSQVQDLLKSMTAKGLIPKTK